VDTDIKLQFAVGKKLSFKFVVKVIRLSFYKYESCQYNVAKTMIQKQNLDLNNSTSVLLEQKKST
jgi:hypothetical protein